MEKEVKLTCLGIVVVCLVLGLTLTVKPFNITGYATKATESDARATLNQAKQVMQEMQQKNFTTLYISDTLDLARQAMGNKSYEKVITLCKGIIERKQKAYELKNGLAVLDSKLKGNEDAGFNMTEARTLYGEALDNFNSERYEESEESVSKSHETADRVRAEQTLWKRMAEASKTFLQKYWLHILISILILIPTVWFTYRKLRIVRLTHSIEHLKIEMQSLSKLMKQTQRDRFELNKIPENTYKIKIDKYSSRLEDIKIQLPVLESNLLILKKNTWPIFKKRRMSSSSLSLKRREV